jgi:hypothetical protein
MLRLHGAKPPFPLHAFMAFTKANSTSHRLTTPSVTQDYTRGLMNNELEQMVMEAVVS